MKSNKTKKMKKRILALLLCMVMMLNGSVSALASEVAVVNETTEAAHVHGEECYTHTKVSEELKCGKEVVEGHTHGDTCYEVTNTPECICTLEETEGHSHDDSCYKTIENKICTLEEHGHGDGCYTTEKKLSCGQEESEAHVHDDECYTETKELNCGTEEHVHGGECYTSETVNICGQEEKEAHSHGDGCYTTVENKTLTCQLEEMESHTHGDECYEWSKELACTIPVEKPAAEPEVVEPKICEVCQKDPCDCANIVEDKQKVKEQKKEESKAEEPTKTEYSAEGEEGKVKVAVTLENAADLPDDAELVTEPETLNEDETAAIEETAKAAGLYIEDMTALDIRFEREVAGEEGAEPTIENPQPANPVNVSVILPEITAEDEVTVYHVGTETVTDENGEEKEELKVEDMDASVNAETGAVEFETPHFSTYVFVEEGEEVVKELKYEDGEVLITVTAVGENAIPENAMLKVTPIRKQEVTEDMTVEEQQSVEAINAEYDLTEEKLKEKFESEEDDEIAGFLAYDITFIVLNENGEEVEVEPNGEVRVAFECKNALLPEEVQNSEIEAKDVTVMHLEEDEAGNVKEVVDMNESKQLESIATTGEKAVETAEFTTSSFSKFVITWIGQTTDLNAICVDQKGTEIENETVTIRKISAISPILIESLNIELDQYTYEKAYLGNENTEVKWVKYSEGWQYSADGTNYSAIEEQTLYFKYKPKGEGAKKLETVNSVGKGIKINLFNYNSQINKDGDTYRPFRFIASTYGIDGKFDKNNDFSADGFRQGIVKRNLGNDGYPIANTGDGYSLGYLFDSTTSGVTSAHTNLDGFFQEDDAKYLYYDSRNNHAQLNVETNSIDVYDAMLFPYKKSGEYTKGGFLPFNRLPSDAVSREIYVLEKYTADYWVGLNVEASFIQPIGGKVNENDMTFEFEGDDDMYVFIDGKLVLDIGGMHGPISGSINFASGLVKVNTPNGVHSNTANPEYESDGGKTPDTYIGEQYKKAGYPQESLEALFKTGKDQDGNDVYTTFKDYTPHTIQVFYFERGSAESNCTIKFNIDPKDIGSAVVEKDSTSTYDADQNPTGKFKFKAYGRTYVEGNSNMTATLLTDTMYTLIKADGTEIAGKTTGSDGIFELGVGEKARFNNLRKNTQFYAEELDVLEGGSNKVTVTGIDTPYEITANEITVSSGEITISGTERTITFKNEATDTIMVKKNWKWGSEDLSADEIPNANIYVGLYKADDTKTAKYVELNKENSWTATFTELVNASDYKVKELRPVTGSETPEFTIALTRYIGVKANEKVIIDGKGYTATYQGDNNAIITNTLLPMTLRVQKVDKDDSSIKLSDATFQLTKPDGTTLSQTTGANGMVTFDNLKPGIYTLVETNAPEGYALNGEIYTITLPYSGTDSTIAVTTGQETNTLPIGGNTVYCDITKTVTNEKLYELPSTGGMGTDMFKISGLALMGGAALFLHKKKEDEEVQG